ncbi:MAG: DNA recombination protein RmuC [bacterium]
MEIILIVLVVLAVAANIALVVYLLRRKGNNGDTTAETSAAANAAAAALSAANTAAAQDAMSKLILSQVSEISRNVDTKIGNLSQTVNDNIQRQFSESRKIVSDVTEKLTKLDETNKQVVGFADQLQSLQDILKNPKQRGILGEYYLETLLKNVLPPKSYAMQYPFPHLDESGATVIVDAVVFVKDKIIPIDSKFSLENYNRLVAEKEPTERDRLEKAFKTDLKNRIDETAKYIQPANGTMDFAFMFIPHEAIYYDLLVAEVGGMKINTRDLIDYAFSKHVLIVSPTSFLAFLQTVLQGLKALQIEEDAKDIIKQVSDLGKHLASFEEYHKKLGTSLGTVVNHFNSSNREFRKIDKDVTRIAGKTEGIEKGEMLVGIEAMALEKPDVEE